ncbi:helix-turn-helix domain-containing protein [Deinococcus rufus]|uniref:Helix-turn-helix domain-containing protein n=1 Tax=Deinococcus rufus TaxID=2136097 RepID=A0ABV7ZC39_9DEIO
MAHSPKPPSPLRLVFGQRLRQERHAQKLTLEDVAERSGLNWSYVAQIERGERNIGIDNIYALAKALGIEVIKLLQENKTLEDI